MTYQVIYAGEREYRDLFFASNYMEAIEKAEIIACGTAYQLKPVYTY